MPRAKITYRDGTEEHIYFEDGYTIKDGMVSFWKGRNRGYIRIPLDAIHRIEDED
jgi:hypothetical protein